MSLELRVLPPPLPDSGDTALALLYVARRARDFEDFAENLAPAVSKFPLEDAQLRLLYDRAWQLFVQQEQLATEEARALAELTTEEPVPLEVAPVAPTYVEVFEYHLARILRITLLAAGAQGDLISANLLYPLVPDGFESVIDTTFRSMRHELVPVGWEPSQKPSRKGGKARTYKLADL